MPRDSEDAAFHVRRVHPKPLTPKDRPGELHQYLADLSRYPALSPEEERALRHGPRETARERLVLGNLRLVISIAKWYGGLEVPLADLVQEGNIGLMKAASHYDFREGVTFSTYATWWIRQSILRSLMNTGRIIRLPEHFQTEVRHLRRTQHALTQEVGHNPNAVELATRLRTTPAWVQEHLRPPEVAQYLSALAEGDDEQHDLTVEERFARIEEEDVFGECLDADERTRLYRAIQRVVSPLEWEVLVRHYGLGDTAPASLLQVAHQMGLSHSQARRLHDKAIVSLRTRLDRAA